MEECKKKLENCQKQLAEYKAKEARKIARFNSLMKAVHNKKDSTFSSQRKADGADAVLRDLGITP